VANVRASNKQLIGAQVSEEIHRAVGDWVVRYPERTKSDFLLLAIVEKLEREGITVDRQSAMRKGTGRQRGPVRYPAPGRPLELNESPGRAEEKTPGNPLSGVRKEH
jgi:hypothetical protein